MGLIIIFDDLLRQSEGLATVSGPVLASLDSNPDDLPAQHEKSRVVRNSPVLVIGSKRQTDVQESIPK